MTADDVRPPLARYAHQLIDIYHAVTYLAPPAQDALREIGLERPWSRYFASRAAPLGAVGAPAVTALFYHFKPSMVAAELPAAWDEARPEDILQARLRGADLALRQLAGDDLCDGRGLAEAADLAVAAAASCTPPGRPLGAANAALPIPQVPHLALWQALTTLREYRGDGHVVALAQAELDGVEALVTITAAGGERRTSIQARRGWSDDQWAAGERRLAERGLLTDGGELTEAGRELRQGVEDLTDRLALPALRPLGAEGVQRMLELVRPTVETIAGKLRLRLPEPPVVAA
jgi:hypothetical protein